MIIRKARVFISGFVQGVGFRQWIKNNANKHSLTGWVRNLPDGRVEAVFAGEDRKIKEIIELCRVGPFLSEVRYLDVIWEDNREKFDTFEILNT